MRRIMFCVATTVIVATFTSPAEANVCSKAYSVRAAVVKKLRTEDGEVGVVTDR